MALLDDNLLIMRMEWCIASFKNELVKQCELNERLPIRLNHLEKVHEDRVEGGSNGGGMLPRSEPSNFATLVNVIMAVSALLLFHTVLARRYSFVAIYDPNAAV